VLNQNHEKLLWLLVALYAVLSVTCALPSAVAITGTLSIIATIARLIFAFMHGSRRLGLRQIITMFIIACVVSWSYESLSIATGFPFGHYVYTAELGPKLGTVPWMIMPSYFGVCYLSWVLAHILLDQFDRQIDSRSIVTVPVIAAFIMVMWDMSIDPASSTFKHEWIWRDGGSYFGVPFSNFLGWFLCVYTIFQIWAIYLVRTKRDTTIAEDQTKAGWYLPIAIYGGIFLGPITAAALATDGTVTDASGQVWPLKALYESLGLVSLVTMLFVICLSFIKVRNNDHLK
jgi:uncharacterized membrane protein